jgi:glycosyltransferase involved in cell wall biosynthesis
MKRKVVRILGIRGVPAAHGGFETFAEQLSLYLVDRGWRVIVYCQEDGKGEVFEDQWRGIERVRIPIEMSGAKGTMLFDWKSIVHASKFSDLCLTLGYNTALFTSVLRVKGIPNLINMDGIEWRRSKWGMLAKSWFWLNDWAGCWLGSHLIADHPEIQGHLLTRGISVDKITMIPYGADPVRGASHEPVTALGLTPGRYVTVIARPEPENSILEIVQSFSQRQRGLKLAVLGNFDESNSYHGAVKAAASEEVEFVGAIYDKPVVKSLRFHSAAYVHGHQVGGTNPSLVEALGAGNAVLAHDNRFNRWVAGDSSLYFGSQPMLAQGFDDVFGNENMLPRMREASRRRFEDFFTWPQILFRYENLLTRYLPSEFPSQIEDATVTRR